MVLPAPWVICKQETQRLTRQHGLVDRCDLVWQRLDIGGMHRQYRIEKVGKPNALGFRDETKECSVAVEAPRSTLLDDFKPGFVMLVKEFVGNLAGCSLVGKLQGL